MSKPVTIKCRNVTAIIVIILSRESELVRLKILNTLNICFKNFKFIALC